MILLSSDPSIIIAWIVSIIISLFLIYWIRTTAKSTKELNEKFDQLLNKTMQINEKLYDLLENTEKGENDKKEQIS